MIFQCGRDKKFRPTIIASFRDREYNKEHTNDFKLAIEFIFLMVKRFMLVPYHAEQWNVIIDLADLSAFSIDIGIIKSISDVTKINFMGFLHKLFIYDVSTSVKFALKTVKCINLF